MKMKVDGEDVNCIELTTSYPMMMCLTLGLPPLFSARPCQFLSE